jgi:UDP-N-acetylglucosamine 4,6-dehydratase/5-epimerase
MRVAITGASGSLGRALLTRLTHTGGADRIVAFSRDEQKRAALVRDFGWHPGVRVFSGDVRDAERLLDLFHGCEAVVHGAARKVVTAHPDEPEEMLKTNILGSMNVITAARHAGVQKVVVVSSDKAVRAENSYGVSKAMMEHLAINANARTIPVGLRVGVVRYGNVLGSTGSVVERWREQLANLIPLSVSNPEMTRFWVSMPQAVDLILYALANLRGGEVVVPHLPAASIGTLVKAVAGEDYSTAPLSDAPMERGGVGRQGGEKVHEELLSAAEVRRCVRRNGYYVVPPYQHEEMWDARPWVGDPVPPDLIYRSDVWGWQATTEELRILLAEQEGDAREPTWTT